MIAWWEDIERKAEPLGIWPSDHHMLGADKSIFISGFYFPYHNFCYFVLSSKSNCLAF